MNNEIEKTLQLIKRCVESNRPVESEEFFKNLQHYFDVISSDEAELDLALEQLFNEKYGSQEFLKISLTRNKAFKESNIILFALYRKLINECGSRFKKFAEIIVPQLICFITSNIVSAKEKELSVLVIDDLIAGKLCEVSYIPEVIYKLLSLFGNNAKNMPSRFQQHTLELLGVISKNYPGEFHVDAVYNFRDILFHTLEGTLVDQKQPSFMLISGVLQALDYYLYNFAPDRTQEPIICHKIYGLIKQISDPGEIRERQAFRKSLTLLTHHSYIMAEQLYRDHLYWHNLLLKWLTWKYDDARVAIYTIQSLHKEIANVIATKEENDDHDTEILKFYVNYFKRILVTPTSKSYEIRIAIRGIGVMAQPCQKLLPESYLDDLSTLVLQRIEYTDVMTDNYKSSNKDMLDYLPDFIQALSQILGYVKNLSGLQMVSLENVIVKLFKDFHFLSTLYHELIVSSLINTFLNVHKLDEQIFDKILDNVVIKSFIWICSSKLLVDIQWDTMTDWKDNVTIKNYTPLLNGLLNQSNDQFNVVSQKIYDKFIGILFKLIDKLNLKTVNRNTTKTSGETGDPNIDLNPVKPKDYHIFFNLVDMYKIVLTENMEIHRKFHFDKWIETWMQNIIDKSLEYPLVSGFLKLTAIGFKISNFINYKEFNNTLIDYLNGIVIKSKQTIGDYQLSCIQLIFSSPVEIICQLDAFECVFINAFAIGINMIWLADYALNTLQKIVNYLHFDKERQSKLLQNVLPCFDSYLLSKIFSQKDDLKYDLAVKEYRKSKKIKKILQSQFDGAETELVKFQKKIVTFLGTLEPHICLYILANEKQNENSFKWDVDQKVRLRLESEQLSPIIYLDSMMPRISELALKESNRQTKLTACELIHATVLYLMGTHNHKGEIWRRLCVILFNLGCDNDVAVQEMFEPLLIQIMHYLSQPNEINSDGANLLIECVMELISHENNYGIRALAARCLREFLMWHIKQTPPEQTTNVTTFKLYNVIEHLKLMCFDSNDCRRLGASLAFNNVYAILREEDDFLNVFWLELFYAFAINYMLTETANCDLTNIDSTLNHLTRVLVERKVIFVEENPTRVKVDKFENNNLHGLCRWILEQMNTKLMNYRRKLMKTYIQLTGGLYGLPNIADIVNEFKNKHFDMLKLLDIYVWILENNLLDEHFLTDPHVFREIIEYVKTNSTVYDDKIIQHVIKLLNNDIFLKYTPREMWLDDTKLGEIFITLFFNPHKQIAPMLNDLIGKVPQDFRTKLQSKLRHDISKELNMIIDSNFSLLASAFNSKQLNAIQMLMQNKTLIREIDEGIRNKLIDKLRNYDALILNISEKNLLTRTVALCFENSYSLEIVVLVMQKYTFFKNFAEIVTKNFLKFSKFYIKEFLSNLNLSNVLDIVKLLNNLYGNIYNNKMNSNQNDLKQLNDNYFGIFENIFSLLTTSNPRNYEYIVIELAMSMAMIYCESLEKFGHEIDKNSQFKLWLYKLLRAPTILVEIKVSAFNLISCFTGPNDVQNPELMDTLKEIQGRYFPLNSSELPIQSIERSQYVSLFLALLNNVAITKSPILLEFVIIATASDSNHILEWKIEENLKIFLKNKKLSQQLAAINIALELFLNEQLEIILRLNILKRFLRKLVKFAYIQTVVEFYKMNIKKINELTNRSLTGRGTNVEQCIVSKFGGYLLIELFFSLVSKEVITNKESAITRAYFDNDVSKIKTGTELSRDFMKKSFGFRQENFYSDNTEIIELYRLLQCQVYNCLATIVSNTQDDIKFYGPLLFHEKFEKNEFLWKHLIVTTDENRYDFPLEHDQYPTMKDTIVSIRNIANDERPTKYSYIQSINVFESSLSQDVTKIDLTNSFVKSSNSEDANAQEGNASDQITSPSVIYLERGTLNDHEIMATLCGVIKHMFDNKLVLPPEDHVNATPPIWVKSVVQSLSDVNHKNVRIFLAKLIDNCRNYFKYYAAVLFAPITRIIVEGCAGETLNSFNVDLISLLFAWNEFYKPSSLEEISLLSELLKFVMKNAYHSRKEIFKLNLELIKCITELWGNIISIPVQLLYDLIDQKTDNGKILCGINLNAIFLSNGLVPWTEATRTNFIRAIILCISNDDAKIYQAASQLIGLCLNYLNGSDEYEQSIHELNEMITTIRRKNDKKGMEVLYAIQKYYSRILVNFLTIIAYNIPNSVGAIKKLYLEMMLNGIELYDEDTIYNEIISIGVKDMLKHYEYQLICLHILNRAMPKFSLANVNSIFADINGFVKSNSRDCRDVTFEILIYLNDNVCGLATTEFDSDNAKMIAKKCQMNLLLGLADVDQLIKNRLYNYWTNHPKLHRDLSFRLKTIFSELYDENIEKYFLNYCCHLLLELVISRPSSKQKIIDYYPQNEFKLIEYNINTDWRSSNRSTITPMFVESQQRSVLSGDGAEMSKYLRVTQTNLMFEPTQDPSAITSTNDNFLLPTHSSFAFDFTPQTLNRRSQNVLAPMSSQSGADQNSEANKKLIELESKFRKRFVKTNEEHGRVQALKSVERRNYNQSKVKYEMKRKEKTVTLYRRYRIGDHPDLSINLLALLLPLQNLAMHDGVVARQTLVSIYTAIVREQSQLTWAINSSINGILKNAKYCEPMLFGTLMEMVLQSPENCFTPPDVISAMSINNGMVICGILHLENRLLLDIEGDETSSKSSTSTLNLETKCWIKLAELYFNLRESDIVSSIYADKLKSNPVLAKGIQYESEGNFKMAQFKYIDIIKADENNAIEQDFCYQSFFECFSHMGQWHELSQYVQKQVTKIDDFWSEWNKEICLPQYIKSELRLILNNEMNSDDFLNAIAIWIKDGEKFDYLKHYFGEEMMMLHFANREYRQAKLFSEKSIVNFLYDWQQMSMLSPKLRYNELLNIRNVAEIHQYIDDLFCDDEKTSNSNKLARTVTTLSERWNSTYLNESTSVQLWDKIITYRKSVLNNLQVDAATKAILNDSIVNLNFKMLDIAAKQNYINLYETTVKRLSFLKDSSTNDVKRLRWMLYSFKINELKSKFKDGEPACRMLIKSWDKIQNELCENSTILQNTETCPILIDGYLELHSIALTVLKLLPSLPPMCDLSAINIFALNNSATASGKLFQHSLDCLEKCIILADKCYAANSLESRKIKRDSYYSMAQFCYEFYESGSMRQDFDIDSHIITSVLSAMRFDSIDARKLFPYLLQLHSLNIQYSQQQADHFGQLFNTQIIDIPDWMFLEWISSIVSYYRFDQSNYLDELILRLCRSYPNAVIYPFKLSVNQYLYANRIDESKLRGFIRRTLDDHLSSPLQNKFIENLMNLCIPSVKLEFHLKKLYTMIKRQTIRTDQDFAYEINYLYSLLYLRDDANATECYKIIEKFKAPIEELLAKTFERDRSTIETRLIEIIGQLKEMQPNKNELILGELSKWLHQYKSFEYADDSIEIPGQYINYGGQPQVQHHIKIIHFYKQLYVFDSLRKPIRLQIFGSNGKKYLFLIKYGEDLRQDERIQKMFHLMSKQMKLDKNCTNHNLDVKTYSIVPVSRYCGITSWLANTKTLINFIRESINRRFNAEHITYSQEILHSAARKFHNFIVKPTKNEPNTNLEYVYGKAVTMYDRNKIISNFNAVKSDLPADLLKFALIEISCSPEHYFSLRNQYTTSLATNSICQWILGIGDRNLSNIMLNDKTGELISIDFGYSFGTGVLNLSVPELLPFRLTPQMLNVLEPLGATGLLNKCMIHTLRCLQMSKKLIMACMEVFVKEPILDWLDITNEELSNTDRDQFQPSERIEIASKKLSGYNPATLTKIQLKSGVLARQKIYLEKYLNLLGGVEQFNVRARLNDSNLSVEDQVAVLLDMATDPAILGITYYGFQPYL